MVGGVGYDLNCLSLTRLRAAFNDFLSYSFFMHLIKYSISLSAFVEKYLIDEEEYYDTCTERGKM